MEVGGKFLAADRVQAEKVEVGGRADLQDVALGRLEVGGSISVGAGTIRGTTEVGGRFVSTGVLTFGDLEVGGMADLKGPAQGKSIHVGGLLTAGADLTFERLEVGGLGTVVGQAQGRDVEIGGRFTVKKSLKLEGKLEVGGRSPSRRSSRPMASRSGARSTRDVPSSSTMRRSVAR